MEKRRGFFLLDKKIGGLSERSFKVTPKGKELLKCYAQFEKEGREVIEKSCQKHLYS
jgi:molybdenum-dependent DNA-binding transcriptional regulator ModE